MACTDATAPPPPGTGGNNGFGATIGSGGTGGSGATGGSAGSGGVAGNGGVAGAGGDGGDGGRGGDGGIGGIGPRDECNNDDDVAALEALQPSNARQIAATCGLGCVNLIGMEPSFTTCVDECVERAVTDLSPECANCYGRLASCSTLNCLNPCALNSCTISCLTCTGYEDCLEALDTCAGRPSIDCPGDT